MKYMKNQVQKCAGRADEARNQARSDAATRVGRAKARLAGRIDRYTRKAKMHAPSSLRITTGISAPIVAQPAKRKTTSARTSRPRVFDSNLKCDGSGACNGRF